MSVDQSSADQTLLSLAARTMAQLRQLASESGVGAGYSAMSRSQLLDALQRLVATPDNAAVGAAAQPQAPAPAPASSPTPVPVPVPAPASSPAQAPEPACQVNFLPRDPQWASVSWQLGSAEQQRAMAAGAERLCLRAADVTGLPPGVTHPHTLQEVVVDAGASAWYLPVPLSDRDYRVELGYRLAGGGWWSLAFSAVARVPAEAAEVWTTPDFQPFSITPEAPFAAQVPAAVASGGVDHERFYQRAVVASPRRLGLGSETVHDQSLALEEINPDQASGAGMWASGLSESGAGLARPRSFWLVADAELIVYGATEPTAQLTIGQQPVPLEADGTFSLRVPFADGEQIYPIRAVAADGEQERSIRLDFERQTPVARVNSREEAQMEWF